MRLLFNFSISLFCCVLRLCLQMAGREGLVDTAVKTVRVCCCCCCWLFCCSIIVVVSSFKLHESECFCPVVTTHTLVFSDFVDCVLVSGRDGLHAASFDEGNRVRARFRFAAFGWWFVGCP